MNQPAEDRFKKIERRLDELERLEKKLDFTTRDASYKSDLAQGMMRQLQENDQEIKQEMHLMRSDMQRMEGKLDQILQFLQPRAD